ncbi:dTDP-glucose 4,6-dehydratase [Kribbella rubisoli]|uniref:dTDP-glucose 4,6-dehydratase n=1 Tax=Kribbella rubisoli TaxID=3075929 RepID=A0A4Q7VY73_9ACTN|nr:NAD-dependent epimerase/dehydratase family protein [Kribbella rubisoli]RZU01691.1 dTDP-glucose 4,6-dehydratase [Kribbella rubisoli]
MSAILVHGAAGFVGSSLIPMLVANTTSPLILTDKHPIDTSQVEASQARIETLQTDSLATLPEGADDIGVAIVLAGETNVDEALVDPRRAFETNIAISIDAAEWLRRNPQSRLVYMSSDEVLGESFAPLSESEPARPTQPYAASKACAETILTCYRDTYGLDLVILRSCNLVGGRQRAQKLIPVAVTSLLNAEPVPVFGSGEQLREWMAVEDLCAALLLAARGDLPGGVYQATSGAQLSVLQVIDLVASVLGLPPKLVYVADRIVEDRSYAMDSSTLQRYGWKPESDVTAAIEAAAVALSDAFRCGERLAPNAGAH